MVAIAFLKERGCIVPTRRRRSMAATDFVYEDAVIEWHARREKPEEAYAAPTTAMTRLLVAGGGVLALFAAFAWLARRLAEDERLDDSDRLGALGERVVADALDVLKRDGYRVFHDVPPERVAAAGKSVANFDHIVVGPTGVYVIETKARSKREGDNKVVVTADGRVLVNGHAPERCPIGQARALARAMQALLERETAVSSVPVRPVVIFPGWYIDDRAYRNAGGDVWTLNERAFEKWVRSPKEQICVRDDQVERLASIIEAHVRR